MSRGIPAPHRVGHPSPLIFHLCAALNAYSQALLAAPRAGSPDFPWVRDLADAARRIGEDLDQIELAAQIAGRLRATVEGLEIWQSHPYRRALEDPPAVWEAGCSQLRDYGVVPEASGRYGLPVLVVPSLINRAYILDLAPRRSMLRWLAARGVRPFLMDWGIPGAAEQGFDLDAYGRERLLPALEWIREETGRDVAVIGYCMGGTLAAGLVARAPAGISRLVTIGAPWEFATTRGISGGIRAMIRADCDTEATELIEGAGEAFGMVPVSAFQALFALVNPIQAALKFQRLARMDPTGPAAELFVALEDWLADGVPMPAPAANELLVDWQIRNATARGDWRFLDGEVSPGDISRPMLAFCGANDSIAPPQVSEGLPLAVPGAVLHRPQTGHVGMVVGGRARAEVLRPLADFLLQPGS